MDAVREGFQELTTAMDDDREVQLKRWSGCLLKELQVPKKCGPVEYHGNGLLPGVHEGEAALWGKPLPSGCVDRLLEFIVDLRVVALATDLKEEIDSQNKSSKALFASDSARHQGDH